MELEKKQIELRSEKVRNLIGQIPPILIRYGSVIIGLALVIIVGVSAFIPYQPSIHTEIFVNQDDNGVIHYTAHIPAQAMKRQSQFSAVVNDNSGEIQLPDRFIIESISDTIQLSGDKAWYVAKIYPVKGYVAKTIIINDFTIPGKIELKRKSILKWIAGL